MFIILIKQNRKGFKRSIIHHLNIFHKKQLQRTPAFFFKNVPNFSLRDLKIVIVGLHRPSPPHFHLLEPVYNSRRGGDFKTNIRCYKTIKEKPQFNALDCKDRLISYIVECTILVRDENIKKITNQPRHYRHIFKREATNKIELNNVLNYSIHIIRIFENQTFKYFCSLTIPKPREKSLNL